MKAIWTKDSILTPTYKEMEKIYLPKKTLFGEAFRAFNAIYFEFKNNRNINFVDFDYDKIDGEEIHSNFYIKKEFRDYVYKLNKLFDYKINLACSNIGDLLEKTILYKEGVIFEECNLAYEKLAKELLRFLSENSDKDRENIF